MTGVAARQACHYEEMSETFIRSTHRYAFRNGEWARLRGTAALPVRGEDRPCYLVEFDDGVTDFWPVEDPGNPYEFSEAGR